MLSKMNYFQNVSTQTLLIKLFTPFNERMKKPRTLYMYPRFLSLHRIWSFNETPHIHLDVVLLLYQIHPYPVHRFPEPLL